MLGIQVPRDGEGPDRLSNVLLNVGPRYKLVYYNPISYT